MRNAHDHLTEASSFNLHVFTDPNATENLREEMSSVAHSLGYYFAWIRGSRVTDSKSALESLSSVFKLPMTANQNEGLRGWDATSDWLGDLSWIIGQPGHPTDIRGILAFYSDPDVLVELDAVSFAILLDTIVIRASQFVKEGIPFHIMVGPVTKRTFAFLNVLAIASHVCTDCLASSS